MLPYNNNTENFLFDQLRDFSLIYIEINSERVETIWDNYQNFWQDYVQTNDFWASFHDIFFYKLMKVILEQ